MSDPLLFQSSQLSGLLFFSQLRAPTITDDLTVGVARGTLWHYTPTSDAGRSDFFICRNATEGAAVWQAITGISTVVPHATTHEPGGTDPIDPVSIGAIPSSTRGVAFGVATLGSDGILTLSQRPAGGGGGAVTSVGLTLPAEFSVTGSPVTTSGALAGAWAVQTANKVFAAPNGSTGVPTFRALAAADIPGLSSTYQPLNANLTSASALSGVGASHRALSGNWRLETSQANVKDYGATGDGVTEDTAAFVAAIASGAKVVYVPAGTFLVDTLFLANAGQYFVGPGTLVLKTGTTRSVILNVSAPLVYVGDGLTLDGMLRGPGSYSDGLIYIHDASQVTVADCTVKNGKWAGVYSYRTPTTYVLGVRIETCEVHGIFVQGSCPDSVIQRCSVVSCRGDGIKVHGYDGVTAGTTSSRCRIVDNLVDYTATATFSIGTVLGLELWGGAHSAIVSRNIVKGQATITLRVFGISIDNSYNCVISGNVATRGIGYGLEGADARYLVYEGNTVEDSTLGFSISSTPSGQIIVRGNTFRTTSEFGLQVFGSACQVSIIGNTFADCLDRAILLNGAGANSLIADNIFVSETLGALIKEAVYPQNTPDCVITNNVFKWQSGTAGAWIVAVDSPRTTVANNRFTAGASTNTNAIVCYAAGTDSVFVGNASHNYAYHCVDTSVTSRCQVIGNRSTSGNAINTSATDIQLGNMAVGGAIHAYSPGWANADIAAGAAIALTKLAAVATNSLLGRTTAATGNVESIVVGTGLTLAALNLSVAYGATGTTACVGNDARLSDARTPVAHVLDSASHTISGKTAGQLLLATAATTYGFTSLSGDATLSGTGVLTLASTITAAGPIGSTSVVPVITYDAKGRVTAVTTATITPAAIGAQPLDAGLTSVAALTGSGYVRASATDTFAMQTGVPYADLTMPTARLLGRTTAGTGAAEEITAGSGLTLTSGVLNTDIRRVDNLTALKGQASPSATSTYVMQGYYVANDGGEGTFNWFPGDTTPDNGGTVIQLTAGGTGRFKRLLADYDYINARSFGAKGDGTTDDIVAINAAINSILGGTVFFPVGVYAISTPIQIHRGIRLLGAGPFDDISLASSKIFLKNSSVCAMLQTPSALAGGATGSTHYMVLENLCFDGNAANQASETTNGAVQFWGAYVGSYVRNVFIKNTRGPGFTLGGIGVDVQIDHLWVIDCVTTGYAFNTNQNLSGTDRDGLLNINHLYVENTSLVVGGDPRNTPSQRGKAIRFHRLVTVNVDDVHTEGTVYGISVESCHVVNIQSCHGAHIGNLTATDCALVSLVDNGTRTISVGMMNTFNEVTGTFWVKKRTGVASNSVVFDMPMGTLPYGYGYSSQSDTGYGPSRHMATIIANQGGVQRVGGYSPTYWKMYSESDSLTQYGFLRQYDNITGFGSNRGQPGLVDKDFISLTSYGNDGDKIDFSVPFYVASRNDAGYLYTGAFLNLVGNPAWSRGSNLYENFVTVVFGTVAPTSLNPLYAGQCYINTVLNKPYISRGGTSPSEWLELLTAGGAGVVTSVALALPAELTVSGSPVTTTGTLTGAWATQTTNKVFAAPNGSTGVPTFRALAAADIPVLPYANTGLVTASLLTQATARILGRTTAATGAIEELTVGAGLTLSAGALTANATGTNTGDQTITLTGNVTGSGTGSFATTIAANAVTLAMQATVATNSLLGRTTAAVGNVEVITVGTGLTFSALNLSVAYGATGTTACVGNDARLSDARTPSAHVLDSASHTISGKTAGQLLLATAATTFAFTTVSGDATLSAAGALTVANSAITLAKMANVVTASFLGRVTAATGVVESLTGTQATTLLDTFTSALKGLAPASGGGTANFLRADGTWAAPAGGGTGTVTSVALALPAELTVSGSPVTVSGTLTGAWATQTTNKVFAAPNGATGVPTFRALALADLPSGVALLTAQTFTGLQTLSAGLTVSAGAVILGTDPGGTATLRVGGSTGLRTQLVEFFSGTSTFAGQCYARTVGATGLQFTASDGTDTLRLNSDYTTVIGPTDPGGPERLRVGSGLRAVGGTSVFEQANAGNAALSSGWIASALGGRSSLGNRVVIGSGSVGAVIGGHNNALTAWTDLCVNPGGGAAILGTDPGGSELFRAGGGSRFNGNVVSAPTAGDPVVYAIRSTGEVAICAAVANTAYIGAQSNHNLSLIANNSAKVVITPAGNVIIGTDPGGSELLRVAGNARVGNGSGPSATPNHIKFANDHSNGTTADKCKIFFYNAGGLEIYGLGVGPSADMQYHSGASGGTGKLHRFYTGDGLRATIHDGGLIVGGADPGGSELLRVNGSVRVNGTIRSNSGLVASSYVAFGNAAGVLTATMTNAPYTGNPTKWIPIDDNGTQRFIPCW